jgi:type I restriction-modification system DNA methylase subunit
MNTSIIRQIFQSKFDYPTYCNEVVHNVFGCNDISTHPELLDTTADGDNSYYIGRQTDADGRELGFFYTRVAQGSDVRRKRVGLRKMIAPYLKYDVDAAIAVFVDENHWRLSYICDMKEGVTNAKRFSYILGDEQGQYKTPLERLEPICAKRGRFVLNDLREAFSVDALSDEFFDEYHIHYDRIVAELARQGKTGAVYHDYVKKLMGRIVFLHFLQKKGWLCGDTNFMLNTFSQSNRRSDYLESVLEPLFFGILNTEPAKREQIFSRNGWQQNLVEKWASIPYLNGGLFERDDVDNLRIVLPESIFSNLFSFLASYNFTVDENDPDDAEIGVDPEMLGKIFESLLEDNKAKGAFYTPKEIVRYMCKESLIAHLASKLPDVADGVVRAFVEHHEMQPELEPCRDTLETALRDVKICDPAIGSGAFPMGLLNELWRCREALGTELSRLQLKKEIIENNIYGVDIERGAIDIARLRFWLSIVVDSEKAEPLPNFDYKFMQGNSLIESYGGFDLSRIAGKTVGRPSTSTQYVIGLDSDLSQKNLQRLLREYFSVTDHQKKATMRHAINAEVKTLIRESVGGTPTFLAKLDQLDPSANQDFFLWHTWFKDIFDKGGFDIVIGNPPYGATITENKEQYKKCYLCTEGKYEIYKYFFEQATKLSCQQGVIAYITPNTWQTLGYFKKMRQILFDKCEIVSITDSLYDIFASATVDTMITILQVNKGNKLKKYKFVENDLKSFHILDFNTNDDSILCSKTNPIIQKIERAGVVLGSIVEIWQGLIAYAGKDQPRIWTSTEKETEYHRKLLYGRDISKYSITWSGEYLKYGEWLHRPRPSYIFDKEKILVQRIRNPKLKTRLVCAYDIDSYINGTGLSNIVLLDQYKDIYSLKYIIGILNSKLINYWFSYYFIDVNIKPEQLRKIPLPKAKTNQEIISLVEKIQSDKQNSPDADTSATEREIDHIVYELYGLTPDEIAVIEGV